MDTDSVALVGLAYSRPWLLRDHLGVPDSSRQR